MDLPFIRRLHFVTRTKILDGIHQESKRFPSEKVTDLRKSWRNTPGHVLFSKSRRTLCRQYRRTFFKVRQEKKSTRIIHALTLRNVILFSESAWKKYPPGLFILKTFFNMEFLDLELTMTGSMESRAYLKIRLYCMFHTF